ncbi:1-phosphatidylinositol-4-phosphate 5-kinase [Blastomyces gilchristii SLH14081]|uniref:1-phosphatidylinositol-4-phosphate 5-kinase n=1 Tax=Blastomyces gilchristii (strain SLH14081) TaxID=559298 RepID=A0A179USC4_BLAGS|nr:1-phosphatidylinositol-4-phosphate 5-kinase [Blastomyces gilchristii SLH14081]OAT11015.1 1-phosphatidylinositol-4-phosphate 5-kinase [Blastomyces gilchristii SLH14081]
MPSFTSEPQLLHHHHHNHLHSHNHHHQVGSSSSSTHDHLTRKSYDKSSISNTFVWTPDVNGENGCVDDASDQFVTNFKGGSLPSLGALGTARSAISPHGQETAKSTNGSLLSVTTGPARDKEQGNGASTPTHHDCLTNGFTDHIELELVLNGTAVAHQTNGTSSRPRSTSPEPLVNGDQTASDDVAATEFTTPSSLQPSMMDGAILTLPEAIPLQPIYRHSSPSASNRTDKDIPIPPNSPRSQRHTLQVPKFHNARKNSRDLSLPTHVNPSEDTIASGDRLASPTSGLRRPSLSLARRTTRSLNSDLHPDEPPPEEDAARWAEMIKQRRASKRRRREEEDEDRVIVGTKVDQNHVNWVTAYNMLTGIRFTVSRTNAKMDRELTDADFEAKHKFSFDITGNELTPSAKYDFKFKDYAPWVFRRLRAKFKLDPADYLVSLTSKYILSELGSPGKSGSFFYFSRDYKYIIKTIHHAEHKLLRRILRDYYEHIENNPNTLISQFYGLHRVKMAYGRKIHFVVMNNLFPPHRDIHQMYDLKGSTIGRDFREEDLEKNPRATLKDLNWIRRNRRLEFGPMKREIFIAQLKRDVSLLQRLKIMDYSLLVGIHDLEKGNAENVRDKTLQVFQPGGERSDEQQPNLLTRTPSRLENARKARELREIIKREKPVPIQQTAALPDEILDERKNLAFYSDDGGFRATHETGQPGDEIYYLGVIDCLTHYGMVKKAEHFWKGLSHNRNQISPIPPDSYGERFLNFITGITMSKEETERERQSKEQGQSSTDGTSLSHAHPRSDIQRVMERAERDAAKAGRNLATDPEPNQHVLSTIRATSSDMPGVTSTLPVVEEVGEAGSTGSKGGRNSPSEKSERRGKSQEYERNEEIPNGDVWNPEFRTATGPSGPPPQLPPPPPKPDSPKSIGYGKGKVVIREGMVEAMRSLEFKSLPPTPHDFPRQPPSPSPTDHSRF